MFSVDEVLRETKTYVHKGHLLTSVSSCQGVILCSAARTSSFPSPAHESLHSFHSPKSNKLLVRCLTLPRLPLTASTLIIPTPLARFFLCCCCCSNDALSRSCALSALSAGVGKCNLRIFSSRLVSLVRSTLPVSLAALRSARKSSVRGR